MFAPVFNLDPRMTIYDLLSKPAAMPFLEQFGQTHEWTVTELDCLSYNKHQDIMLLLKPYTDKWMFPPEESVTDSNDNNKKQPKKQLFHSLMSNPRAIPLIEKLVSEHPNLLDANHWNHISSNPNALDILKRFPDKIALEALCCNENPAVLALIEERLSKMTRECWACLSSQPYALPLLETHVDNIDWRAFSQNTNPDAILLWETNIDKLDKGMVSRNPAAIRFLEHNPNMISYPDLGRNPAAYHLIVKNMDKMVRSELCKNTDPKVVKLLEEFIGSFEPIEVFSLRCNSSAAHLFVPLDTAKMREKCRSFAEEMIAYVLHPLRLMRISEEYGIDMEEYMDMI